MATARLLVSLSIVAAFATVGVATLASVPAIAAGTSGPVTPPTQSGQPSSTNGTFSSNVLTSGATTPTRVHPANINAAPAAELAALPGVGTGRADAIVAGRPYHQTGELVSRGILPSDVYRQIKPLIVAN
jgi:DNA uptake protein ComE-like DNA-binding protein